MHAVTASIGGRQSSSYALARSHDRRAAVGIAATLVVLSSSAFGAAPEVGQLVTARGAVSAGAAGQVPRLIATGSPIGQGEIISTGPDSFALVELGDRSRIVLRPNTAFAIESFNVQPSQEANVMRLLRGGMRAVTGFINKRRAGSVQLRTATATIGIRGTDFSARLCQEGDCKKEASQYAGASGIASRVAARVSVLSGDATRVSADGTAIPLERGAPLYVGDVVRTAGASHAALQFRDETRVVLSAETDFQIEKFDYVAAEAAADNSFFKLVKGGMRSLTGLIAQRNAGRVKVGTRVATIGIRGTGFDLKYPAECGEGGAPGLVGSVWKGKIAFEESNAELGEGQNGCVDRLGGPMTEVKERPDMGAPRPDEIADDSSLFAAEPMNGDEDGLHVSVVDGAIVLANDQGETSLGVGENGYSSLGGTPVRYDSSSPVGRADPYFRFDPTASAEEWDSYDPVGLMCPIGA
jgi:hypothetical protein